MPDLPPALFDLTLTEEQVLMRESVRRFAQSELRPIARKSDEAASVADDVYAKSLELGFHAAQAPEALGGYGAARSPVSNVLIAEDLAYGDMALAIGALSSSSFIHIVMDQGSAEQRAQWLPPLLAPGFHPAALAWLEPSARFDPRRLHTRATPQGDGHVLRGEKTMVAFAQRAEQLLVIAELEGHGPQAFRVPRDARGLSATRESFMGLRALELGRLRLDDVVVGPDARVGGDAGFDLGRMLDLCRIGSAALAVGVGQAVLDYVKAYANERVAFGEPIANRQSVAFMIADMAIELDGLRLLTYRAAARAERGLPFRREAFLAHLQATDKGMKIGSDGVQVLGGHGFIREHMVELWYRNLRAVSLLDGCIAV